VFAVVIGLLMAALFRNEERSRVATDPFAVREESTGRRGGQDGLFLIALVAVLVFANWGAPNREVGLFAAVHRMHWWLAAGSLAAVVWMMNRWYEREELGAWVVSTWSFAKQITPLLLGGILVSGWLMGRPGQDAGLLPASWIAGAVGGNGVGANFLSALVGAFMYFATLTEVPILETLLGAGMGAGPALALLLAGPALSLPSMLVINAYLGPRKTVAYVGLVVLMATVTGWLYGRLVG
jgi:hypothetical protein